MDTQRVTVAIAPPVLYLGFVRQVLRSYFFLCAQNCTPTTGAFTGEISVSQIKDFGVPFVLIGQAERRIQFGETESYIHAKIVACLQQGLTVLVCIGEQDANKAQEQITKQLQVLFANTMHMWNGDNVIIAYEPWYAIGNSNKAPHAKHVQHVHESIRMWCKKQLGDSKVAEKMRIVYGGGVQASSAKMLVQCADVDGFLVGAASQQVQSFVDIVRVCYEANAKL